MAGATVESPCLPCLSEQKGQLPVEKLNSNESIKSATHEEVQDEDIEQFLRERAVAGEEDGAILLGQFLFERERCKEARALFHSMVDADVRAKYQLAVMYFDGLGGDTNFKKGLEYMKEIAESTIPRFDTLVPLALYNIGRAYFEGYGVRRSESTAEEYWLLAAKDGKPNGSIKAQTVLGMFYSRPNEEVYDLRKAHFWHQEATGNGSIESQGVLGVMYEYGLGVKKNEKYSLSCYKHASEAGNIYATGRLAFLYYKSKLYKSAVDTCERIVDLEDVNSIAEKTGCSEAYVKKGLSMACFLYARCFQCGIGIIKNPDKSMFYYKKAASYDFDITSWMQCLLAHNVI